MKRLVLAAVAAALVAPGATAGTGSCLDLADPVGDVQVWDDVPAVPRGIVDDVDAVDVVGVRVEATTAGSVSVTFTLAGAPAPRPGMRYGYWMEFSDATYDYRLTVDVDDVVRMPLAGGPYELEVTPRSGGRSWTHSVSGSVDVVGRTVTVAADTSVLSDLDPGRSFTIERLDTFGGPGVTYGPLDSVVAPHTLVVGDGCA